MKAVHVPECLLTFLTWYNWHTLLLYMLKKHWQQYFNTFIYRYIYSVNCLHFLLQISELWTAVPPGRSLWALTPFQFTSRKLQETPSSPSCREQVSKWHDFSMHYIITLLGIFFKTRTLPAPWAEFKWEGSAFIRVKHLVAPSTSAPIGTGSPSLCLRHIQRELGGLGGK